MRLLQKYRHGFIALIYAIFYTRCFYALEHRTDVTFHLIHTPLDQMIPFCEYFIVPYIFWFVYMFIAILFFIFINPSRLEYYQMVLSLGTGMTLFLLISYLYPNMVDIRPDHLVHGNLFTDVVILLYHHDTPTNVFPSIHAGAGSVDQMGFPYSHSGHHCLHPLPETAFHNRCAGRRRAGIDYLSSLLSKQIRITAS